MCVVGEENSAPELVRMIPAELCTQGEVGWPGQQFAEVGLMERTVFRGPQHLARSVCRAAAVCVEAPVCAFLPSSNVGLRFLKVQWCKPICLI